MGTLRISFGTCFIPHILYDLLNIVHDVDFDSHANSKTPFFVDADIHDAMSKFQNASETFFQWFNQNQTKANPSKCCFI